MIDNDLFQEHQQLCHKLQMFINQARINEQKLQRFQNLELRLIGSRTFSELVKQVLCVYKKEFALDIVTLTLLDKHYELQRIINECERYPELSNLLFCEQPHQLEQLFGHPVEPKLGQFDVAKHAFLIPSLAPPLKSIATVPLVRFGKLIGSLNLGSESRERFSNEFGTEFLLRLATIVAICLENTMNHERLKRVGLTDGLTGINNRRFFDQRLGEEVARSIRSREPLACLFIDIDHFKRVNDDFGHQIGDKVLREIATQIRDQLRNSDVLGRYGGEEFSILLINTHTGVAREIAERIRAAIENYRFVFTNSQHHTQSLAVKVSIGIGLMETSSPITEIPALCTNLIKQADKALYLAKNTGRNRVMLATDTHPYDAFVSEHSLPNKEPMMVAE